MEFRIADTFTDSLARLRVDEQKAVKTTAFDLQMNPSAPGFSFHRLDKAKDKNFWSVRVGSDIRLIVHKTSASILLCYVDHHDKAYSWAERRKLETHPKTGAAQLVEIRERVEEIAVPVYIEVAKSRPGRTPIFSELSDEALLAYGVPLEWLRDVRLATEDTLLNVADHLPSEAAEALLELATGGKPQTPQLAPSNADPFAHPDALRRFRVMNDVEELERALAFPWEKWTIFLHPSQRQLIEREYSGAARVSGSAGTGKTIVALHRAVHLARRNPDARVLLTTFSETLANALRSKLRCLIHNEPRLGERVEVHALNGLAARQFEQHFGRPQIATEEQVRRSLENSLAVYKETRFTLGFLFSEWKDLVDEWQLKSWEDYRDVKRLGRKTRLQEPQRYALWAIFKAVTEDLEKKRVLTQSDLFAHLLEPMAKRKHPLFDYIVVDEAQDVSVQQLRFLAALGHGRSERLFFTGDLGQRIFQQPFSWKQLGVDIRGRSRTLHINYRTSHQIRSQADRLLGPEVSDVDGNIEGRRGTISVFNGPVPTILSFRSEEHEAEAVKQWLQARVQEGTMPHEIGVFVRSDNELGRARLALSKANIPFRVLDDRVETVGGQASVGAMHLAKGLEFRAVTVMACDDEIIPLQSRISSVTDDSDLEEVYNTERHLLYVACTRARDNLLITSVAPASEFLDDLLAATS